MTIGDILFVATSVIIVICLFVYEFRNGPPPNTPLCV